MPRGLPRGSLLGSGGRSLGFSSAFLGFSGQMECCPQLFYRRTALALEESFFFRNRFLVSFHQHRKCVPNTRGINRESLTGVRGDWRVFDTHSLVVCILLMESLAVLFETHGKHSRDLKARRSVSPFPWLLRTPKNAVQTARRRYVSSSGLARPRSFPEFLTSICAGYK